MIFEAKQIKKIKEMINTRFPLCAAIMSFFIFPLVFFIICTVSLLIGMLSGGIDAIVGLIMIFAGCFIFPGLGILIALYYTPVVAVISLIITIFIIACIYMWAKDKK